MNYEDIFRERGDAYAHAMATRPEARREEFLIPVSRAALRDGDVVVDVPAGGGYLQRYLPPAVRWLGHEPCASFFTAGSASDQPLLPLPWADGQADAALSIAGVHHLDDRAPLYREIHRVLRPGGRFVLADVHEESVVARFLDGFVGSYNSTGHRGNYLTAADTGVLESCGFRVTGAERVRYHWWFASRDDMASFCRLLFDMRAIDIPAVTRGIEDILGVSPGEEGIGMCWELYVLSAARR
ncbi:MAG: methyltransferase domain-containing protein [Chromatiales bacterium]|nr:methyltransferase domain-containing protein [Chromatiales bacterium]